MKQKKLTKQIIAFAASASMIFATTVAFGTKNTVIAASNIPSASRAAPASAAPSENVTASSSAPSEEAKGSESPSIAPENSETPASSNPDNTAYEKGDVNGDKTVDLSDVQLALQAYLDMITLDDVQKDAADISGDGNIDLTDVQMILRIYLQLD